MMNNLPNLRFPHPTSSTESSSSNQEISATSVDSKRLWIGNLDPKLTEFHLLKLVQSFGTIQHFDFLFHRTGPHVGQPRGYAFVTYEENTGARKCIQELDSKRILDRYVSVRWAHQASQTVQDDEEKIRSKIPALGIKPPEKPVSKSKAILAIEAKLRSMEKDDTPNFSLSRTSLQPIPSTFQAQSRYSASGSVRNKPYDRNASKRSQSK